MSIRRDSSADSAARFLALRRERNSRAQSRRARDGWKARRAARSLERRQRRFAIESRVIARRDIADAPGAILSPRTLRPKPEALLERMRDHWTGILMHLDRETRTEIFEDFDLRVASGASRAEAAAAVMAKYDLARTEAP